MIAIDGGYFNFLIGSREIPAFVGFEGGGETLGFLESYIKSGTRHRRRVCQSEPVGQASFARLQQLSLSFGEQAPRFSAGTTASPFSPTGALR